MLATARAYAESLQTSTCTIRARSTGTTTDPGSGAVTDTPGATHYSGPCRVRPAGTQGSTADVGGAEVFTYDYVISVPFAEADVAEGDRVTVDSSPDPALVSKVVEVEKVDRGDHITARRLFCSEVS
jgi:hypothetical protein